MGLFGYGGSMLLLSPFPPMSTAPPSRHRLLWGLCDECGATAVEYGLMIALIALVVVSSAATLGRVVGDAFGEISDVVAASRSGNGHGAGGNGQGNQGVGNGNGGPVSAQP